MQSTTIMSVSQVSGYGIKNPLEEMAKNLQNSQFWPIFCNKKSINNQNKKIENSGYTIMCNYIILHIQAKYRKGRMKTEGAYG